LRRRGGNVVNFLKREKVTPLAQGRSDFVYWSGSVADVRAEEEVFELFRSMFRRLLVEQ